NAAIASNGGNAGISTELRSHPDSLSDLNLELVLPGPVRYRRASRACSGPATVASENVLTRRSRSERTHPGLASPAMKGRPAHHRSRVRLVAPDAWRQARPVR